jgi:hypothetical protein
VYRTIVGGHSTMFGKRVWRPVAVAAVLSGALFLPDGVALAAGPDALSCSRLAPAVRDARAECRPATVDGVDGLFIGPVSPTSTGGATSTAGPTRPATATPTAGPTAPSTTRSTARPTTRPDDSGDDDGDAAADDDRGGRGGRDGDHGDHGGRGSGGSAGHGSSGSDDDADDDSGSDDADRSSSRGGSSGGSSGSGSSGGSSSGGGSSSYSTAPSTGSYSTAASCPTADESGTTGTGTTGAVEAGQTADGSSGTGEEGVLSGLGQTLRGVVAPLVDAVTGGSDDSTGTGTATTAGRTTGTAGAAAGTAEMPGQLIDLANWYLTLPTGKAGSPDTIENPGLEKFTNEFFKLTPNRDGVVFTANAGGVTTKNSHYPRSELREMNGAEKASWSNTTGTHTLEVCEAFTQTPASKPEVVGVQIHDADDDVLQIRLEGRKLAVQYADGKSEAVLDDNYELGTPFHVKVDASGGKVAVAYNGRPMAELPLSGSGWYWKVGAYVQSNPEKGEDPSAVGEVTVYSLNMVHQG